MARGSFVRPDLRRFPQFLCGPSPSLSLPRTTFAFLGRVTLPPSPKYHGRKSAAREGASRPWYVRYSVSHKTYHIIPVSVSYSSIILKYQSISYQCVNHFHFEGTKHDCVVLLDPSASEDGVRPRYTARKLHLVRGKQWTRLHEVFTRHAMESQIQDGATTQRGVPAFAET